MAGCLDNNILFEPIGRNTAPAVALAALNAIASGTDPILLVLPADHLIKDNQSFRRTVQTAIPLAESGALVTFGIIAKRPETGYSYIKRGRFLREGVFQLAAFMEKPTLTVAEECIASGDFDWNSGMYLFRASRYLAELQKYHPVILTACQKAMAAPMPDVDFIRVDAEVFKACAEVSVDYAVMEKTDAALLVSMDAGWSDVGAFAALWEVLSHDADGNVNRGDVITIDSHNNLIFSKSTLVATVGLRDHVVVQTKDAILVAPRDRVSEVKGIVSQLKAKGRLEHQIHREVYRPWGKYDSVDAGLRYLVKRITVLPGGQAICTNAPPSR